MIAGLRIALWGTIFLLVTPVLALIQWIAIRFDLPLQRTIPRLWHRLILKCLGVRVRITGALSEKRPLLVISNHISWLDIMILGHQADVRFIAKSEVSGWPGMGTIARLNHTVFVERERKTKTGAKASEIATRLAGGDALVLFPEGTTSDGNALLPFKSSLFGAAKLAIDEAGAETVWLQPAAVAYTRLHGTPLGRFRTITSSWVGDIGLAPSIAMFLGQRAYDAELRFGEPVAYINSSSRKQATKDLEDAVRILLREIRANPRKN